MIEKIWRRLFVPRYAYDRLNFQRAQGLLIMSALVLGMTIARLGGQLLTSGTDALYLVMLAVSALILITSYVLTHQGNYTTAAGLFVTALWVIAVRLNITSSGLNSASVLFMLMPVVAAASLFSSRRFLGAVTLVIAVTSIVIYSGQSRNFNIIEVVPAFTAQADLAYFIGGLMLLALFSSLLISPVRQMFHRAQHNAEVLQKIAEFSSTILDQTQSLEAACAETILFLRNKLGYPFAQMLIVGGKGVLNQRIRAGLSTQYTTREDFTLSELSAIQQSFTTGTELMVSREDSAPRISHFLPATSYGLCLPVNEPAGAIGVLDVQTSTTPFTVEDIAALKAVAAHLAATIADIRVIEALRNNIRQQEEVAEKMRERLNELQRYNITSAGNTWDAYLRQRGQNLFGMDMRSGVFTSASDLPEHLLPVLKNGALLVQNQEKFKVVNVPINLHGEIVGAMSFTVPKEHALTERQIDTAQIVANRLALAIENKRLVEQTRAQAARERKANEAANLLLSATNVEAVMDLAVQTFNEAMGAINTRIHLQPTALTQKERSGEPV